MNVDLTGRVALVTGGSTGIGRATAEALAQAGCKVAVGYRRNDQAAQAVVDQIVKSGGQAIAVQGDVANEDDVIRVVQEVIDAYSALDILVNNAGALVARISPLEAPTELWREVMATNLDSVFYVVKHALPHLKESDQGRIVNLGSIAGHIGGGNGSWPYGAAKGGVHTLTKGLATELASFGITVNAVSPGVVDTPFHEKFTSAERMNQLKSAVPLGRVGEPEDVAPLIVFLTSKQASYITGQVIEVNGGQLML